MRLLFKQRAFSWLDSYDIYNENEEIVFSVKSKLAWGHVLVIFDHTGREVGRVEQQIFTFMPRFRLYDERGEFGVLSKTFRFFKPEYHIDSVGWSAYGNWLEFDYSIVEQGGREVACISKELFRFTDTYVIDVADPADALGALMFVLAIDAEKCSRD